MPIKSASLSGLRDLAITTAEGVDLGLVGIGLPDIVLFVGVVLKGVYETAPQYGYHYDAPEDRWFLLKLMETAMLRGPDWDRANSQVNTAIRLGGPAAIGEEALKQQPRRTADCFAMDMLVLKFIQGTPIVGVLGGLGNPIYIYYRKVLNYVQVKYRKRYLLDLKTRSAAKPQQKTPDFLNAVPSGTAFSLCLSILKYFLNFLFFPAGSLTGFPVCIILFLSR